MGSEDNDPRNSGKIKVTWCECPNEECQSRLWVKSSGWDVDFEGDKFKCGTCEQSLGKPFFFKSEILPLFVNHLDVFLHGLRQSVERLKRHI